MNQNNCDKTLNKIWWKSEEMLNALEQRIHEEITKIDEKYIIYLSIIERSKISFLDKKFHIILSEDNKEKGLDLALFEKLNKSGVPIMVDRIFLEGYSWNDKQKKNYIHGKIITNKNEYIVPLEIIPNLEYLLEVKRIFEMSVLNQVNLSNFNLPYLYHFYKIILMDEDFRLKEDESILNFQIYYQEIKGNYSRDFIPIWNINKKVITTRGTRELEREQYVYKHVIPRYRNIDGCLIVFSNEFEGKVSYDSNETTIYQTSSVIEKWELLLFEHIENTSTFEYPVFSNQLKNNFINAFYSRNGKSVLCRGEIERIVRSFRDSAYLEYLYCEVGTVTDYDSYTLYNMLDDRFDPYWKTSPDLILYFKDEKKCGYYSKDILSFLVAEIQNHFVGYHVVGKFVEGEI